MSAKFTKENLIARRDELAAEIKAIEEISGPKREARDKLVRESDEAIKALNDEIRKIEVGLFDLKNEAGTIARALGGRVLGTS